MGARLGIDTCNLSMASGAEQHQSTSNGPSSSGITEYTPNINGGVFRVIDLPILILGNIARIAIGMPPNRRVLVSRHRRVHLSTLFQTSCSHTFLLWDRRLKNMATMTMTAMETRANPPRTGHNCRSKSSCLTFADAGVRSLSRFRRCGPT